MQRNMAGIFPQFAATAATFSRASGLITRVGSDAHLYDDPQDANIASLLDSKYDAEKAQGMKRLIALMSQGIDVGNHFPQVVKNIVSPSLEVKKLVYIYLVHFAEKRSDEALLSINSFQKDLSDINPLVRAWALRAMSGIRLRVVLPLVVMAVNKAAKDPSPYVRRCAAHAIPKIFSLDHEQHAEVLEELVGLLLSDNSGGVVGAAAAAFIAVCPEKLHIVGPVYRKLCEMLPDVEEWGQVALMDILMHYAVGRYGAPRSSVGVLYLTRVKDHGLSERSGASVVEETWAGNDESTQIVEQQLPVSDISGLAVEDENGEMHPQLRILLQYTAPLLWNQNSAVVVAAAVIHWLFAPKESLPKITKPLLFLLRSSFDSQFVVLSNIATFVKFQPFLFEDYYEDFFVRPSDNLAIRAMKLDILTQIATESNIHIILEELQAYMRDPVRQFAADTVSAIGRCAVRLPSVASICLDGIFKIVQSSLESSCGQDLDLVGTSGMSGGEVDRLSKAYNTKKQGGSSVHQHIAEATVVTQAVVAIRLIVQQLPSELEIVFCRLVRFLEHIKVPTARAIIVWMVGEYSTSCKAVSQILPIVMSYLGGTFLKESDETKLQILNTSVKVVLQSNGGLDTSSKQARLVLQYVLNLGRSDLNWDIRDRARMFQELLASQIEPKLVETGKGVSDVTGRSSQPVICKEGPIGKQKRSQEKTTDDVSSVASMKAAVSPSTTLGNISNMLLLVPRLAPAFPALTPDRSSFLPGSMSHIVQHKAPGYRSLPGPFSKQDGEPCANTEGQNDIQRESGYSRTDNAEAESGDSEENVSDSAEGSTESYSEESGEDAVDQGIQGNGRIYTSPSGSSPSDHLVETNRGITRQTKSRRMKQTSHGSKSQNASAFRGITSKEKEELDTFGPLISLSDSETGSSSTQHPPSLPSRGSMLLQSELNAGQDLLSSLQLEAWLGPTAQARGLNVLAEVPEAGFTSLALGTVTVEPKKYVLLDFTNGGGLEIKFSFSWTASLYSQRMACVRLYLHNRSLQAKSSIVVKAANAGAPLDTSLSGPDAAADDAVIIPLEEISELGAGQKSEGNLHVDFRHKLKPAKLVVACDGSLFPVKLTPEVGALLRPAFMTSEMFVSAESRLSGMLESSRRCSLREPFLASLSLESLPSPAVENRPLQISRTVAYRVFESAHVSLVSATMKVMNGSQGLELRFSGETLTGSLVCLVTATLPLNEVNLHESEIVPVTIKVNCEDTVFGLSLLKQLDNALGLSYIV